MKKAHLLTALGLMGSVATSQAAFNLLDDFESYTDGASISTANPTNWSNNTADGTVGSAGGNQYLVQGGTTNAHTVFNSGSTLLSSGVGTYFFRASMPSGGSHHGTAFSNRDGFEEGWSDAKGIIRLGGGDLGTTIFGRDGSAYPTIAAGNAETWYNFWLVINLDDQDYDIWIQSDDDVAFNTQTKLTDPDTFAYRATGTNTGPATSVESLFFRSANDGGEAYFDDLYFDGSGQNLANPVPEPTVSLLGALGLLGLLRRRR